MTTKRTGAVFAALADGTRLRIVELLRRGELDAGEIAEHFPTSRPAISRHLRVLREHGVVRVRGAAQRRIYALDPVGLRELDRWLEPYRRFWDERLDALEKHVEATRGRTENQRDRDNGNTARR